MNDLFAFLKEVVQGIREWINPANKRLRNIEEINQEISRLMKERDKIITRKVNNDEEADKKAVDLGLVVNDILRLRRKRRNIEIQ